MLGADTRATEGPIVADKNCEKIHYISKYIYCCGAGTSADTENTTGACSGCLSDGSDILSVACVLQPSFHLNWNCIGCRRARSRESRWH